MEKYMEQFEAIIMKLIGLLDEILEKYLGPIFGE